MQLCGWSQRTDGLSHLLFCELQGGMKAFYKGWGANTLKVVPQNSIRFVSYELLKTLLGIQKAKTDT
jgi:hypothetical protein